MRKAARGKPAMNAPTVASPLRVTHEVTNQPPPYGGHTAFIATRLEGEWGAVLRNATDERRFAQHC